MGFPIAMRREHGGCRVFAMAPRNERADKAATGYGASGRQSSSPSGWKGVFGSLRLPDVKPPCILGRQSNGLAAFFLPKWLFVAHVVAQSG
jgi:hypothetical protein